MPHQKTKNMETKDGNMQDFFKGICKDMKEETERVRHLIKEGIIKPLPDKEGVIYDIPMPKEQSNK